MQGAAKGQRRYRYYVSSRLVTGSADEMRNGWRLSVPEIERTVAVAARQLLNDHAAISASACNLGIGTGNIPAMLEAAGEWSRRLQSEADGAAALSRLVDKVNMKPGGIELSINSPVASRQNPRRRGDAADYAVLRAANEAPRCGDAAHNRRRRHTAAQA